MSKFRETKLLLQDILLALNKIFKYCQDLDYESFSKDDKTIDAVLHNIQILGEAGNQIPKSFREENTKIEWDKMIRSRHILVHNYHEVDYEIIWRIIQDYLPPLKEKLKTLLDSLS